MAIESSFFVRKDDRVIVGSSEPLMAVMIRASSSLKNNESVAQFLWLPVEQARALIADLQGAVDEIDTIRAAKAQVRAQREAA
jgi:hypothetical protein